MPGTREREGTNYVKLEGEHHADIEDGLGESSDYYRFDGPWNETTASSPSDSAVHLDVIDSDADEVCPGELFIVYSNGINNIFVPIRGRLADPETDFIGIEEVNSEDGECPEYLTTFKFVPLPAECPVVCSELRKNDGLNNSTKPGEKAERSFATAEHRSSISGIDTSGTEHAGAESNMTVPPIRKRITDEGDCRSKGNCNIPVGKTSSDLPCQHSKISGRNLQEKKNGGNSDHGEENHNHREAAGPKVIEAEMEASNVRRSNRKRKPSSKYGIEFII